MCYLIQLHLQYRHSWVVNIEQRVIPHRSYFYYALRAQQVKGYRFTSHDLIQFKVIKNI